MAEIEVEDILRLLQKHAGGKRPPQARDPSSDGPGALALEGARQLMAQIEASLAAAQRARDQLPPLTTRRRGLMARLELWLKRRIKRATHWYTFGQVNFNSAVHNALQNALLALELQERRLASIEGRLAALVSESRPTESEPEAIERLPARLEERLASLLAGDMERLRAELLERIELVADEQRVCFKQLALEVSEAASLSDRARRQAESRLDEMARRIAELREMSAEIGEMRRRGVSISSSGDAMSAGQDSP